MTTATKTIKNTELQVGNIVHFYGARFEIVSAEMTEHHPHGPVMVAMGKWLDGAIVRGYFGPGVKDWNFQGNSRATVVIEC